MYDGVRGIMAGSNFGRGDKHGSADRGLSTVSHQRMARRTRPLRDLSPTGAEPRDSGSRLLGFALRSADCFWGRTGRAVRGAQCRGLGATLRARREPSRDQRGSGIRRARPTCRPHRSLRPRGLRRRKGHGGGCARGGPRLRRNLDEDRRTGSGNDPGSGHARRHSRPLRNRGGAALAGQSQDLPVDRR